MDEHELLLVFPRHHEAERHGIRAELDKQLLDEKLRVVLECRQARDALEVRLPRRARPPLQLLQVLAFKVRNGSHEYLDVLVLQGLRLFCCLVLEGILAVGQDHHGALGMRTAVLGEHGVSKRERLGHVREALLILQLTNLGPHQVEVRGQGLDPEGRGDGVAAVRLGLQAPVAEEDDADLDGLQTKVLRLVLHREVLGKFAKNLEARLLQGAAPVDRQDQILLRDAHLVTNAVLRVAHIMLQAFPRIIFRALALAADGN
mmetsp:Transcript_3648/g.10741  ORF Transcript_3648/g.10741 Transcript_3648/m.10741 type:complete len:260 (+) Transcript_3648:466-1245(+)